MSDSLPSVWGSKREDFISEAVKNDTNQNHIETKQESERMMTQVKRLAYSDADK